MSLSFPHCLYILLPPFRGGRLRLFQNRQSNLLSQYLFSPAWAFFRRSNVRWQCIPHKPSPLCRCRSACFWSGCDNHHNHHIRCLLTLPFGSVSLIRARQNNRLFWRLPITILLLVCRDVSNYLKKNWQACIDALTRLLSVYWKQNLTLILKALPFVRFGCSFLIALIFAPPEIAKDCTPRLLCILK